MFGIKFVKVQPTTYLMVYNGGRITREGTGLALFYFAPTTSLVAVPTESTDAAFIFQEITGDFQEVTVQGQVTYRIAIPQKTSQMLNFTLNPQGTAYASDDPKKLPQRLVNHLQVITRMELQKLPLREALRSSDALTHTILERMQGLSEVSELGVEVMGFSILAIKPNPETARALETEMREQLLQEADSAVYARRNAAVQQERSIKENELNTELAVEQKKRQIREATMDAEIAVQEKQHAMAMSAVQSKISVEKQNKTLFALSAENARIMTDAKAYEISATLKPLREMDAKQLEVLATHGMDSGQLIAQAFRQLSENAEKIGELNVSPDLLHSLMNNRKKNG